MYIHVHVQCKLRDRLAYVYTWYRQARSHVGLIKRV